MTIMKINTYWVKTREKNFGGVNGRFQAKPAKYYNLHIFVGIASIPIKFCYNTDYRYNKKYKINKSLFLSNGLADRHEIWQMSQIGPLNRIGR